jgi:glucosamine 6-phosphate synthetase-like amidotransferase/phosphosugar isomerase protein
MLCFKFKSIINQGENMNKLIVGIGAFCFASTAFAAGPFGIEKGTKLASLGESKEIAPGKYTFTPKKAHPAFETYVALVTDSQGVCWIKAIGKDIRTSTYGTELKSEFSSFESKLSKAYGENKKYDYLMPDSIWDEPKDYMPALIKKERVLATLWSAEHNSKMKDNLKSLALFASGSSRESGYIAIEYEFDNYDSCKKEISAKVDDVL